MNPNPPEPGPAVPQIHGVIGIGTGWCGTQSFVQIMARQPGVARSRHEAVFLPWLGAPSEVWRKRAEALLPEVRPGRTGLVCEMASW